MGRSDSRPLISPHFVAFAWRYRRLIPCFVPTNSGPELGIILELVSRAPTGHLTTETIGSLRFPSTPHVPSPCSWTPAGPKTPGHCSVSDTAPACVNNGGSHEQRFRGSIARHWDSLESLHNKVFWTLMRTSPFPDVDQAYIKLCKPATFFMIRVCRRFVLRYRSDAIRHTFILPMLCSATIRRRDTLRFFSF